MSSELALSGWALILGASSGFGEATALELARRGMDIFGVHLDRRASLAHVAEVVAQIRASGRQVYFFNANAADAAKRGQILDEVARLSSGQPISLLLHSLAFGTLRPYVGGPGLEDRDEPGVTPAQMEMTLDVMAHSLVYWTQDLVARALLAAGSRVLAMTSAGATRVIPSYGAISAAKAALEAHVRQLAYELAPRGITANALCAGVTDTPAARKIPRFERIRDIAEERNPSGRLTRPEDVARAVALLAHPCAAWVTGNVIHVDGGEAIAG